MPRCVAILHVAGRHCASQRSGGGASVTSERDGATEERAKSTDAQVLLCNKLWYNLLRRSQSLRTRSTSGLSESSEGRRLSRAQGMCVQAHMTQHGCEGLDPRLPS